MKHQVGNVIQSVTSGVILHQVNCQGVMGSGIAKEIRETYPVVWEKYRQMCAMTHIEDGRHGETLLGMAQLIRVSDTLVIGNLFGQQYYGRDPNQRYTSYDALDAALDIVAEMLPDQGFTPADVHHPLIGCGLGGGDWTIVSSIIQVRLGHDTTLWTLD